MSPIPDNVIDKQLYGSIKDRIHAELRQKGIRWGVYASSRLVRDYKNAGGKFKNAPKKGGISRWFMQRWINICESDPPNKLVECGRKDIRDAPYPVCRPYIRVADETPTTYGEMAKSQVSRICRRKRKSPLDILPAFA